MMDEMFSILPDESVAQTPDTKVGNIRIKQVNILIIVAVITAIISVVITPNQHHHQPYPSPGHR